MDGSIPSYLSVWSGSWTRYRSGLLSAGDSAQNNPVCLKLQHHDGINMYRQVLYFKLSAMLGLGQ